MPHHLAILGVTLALHASGLVSPAAKAVCPPGVPTQAITVVNQANVRPEALGKVENAVVGQSMQLRAAWGTPCVQFGPGGWPLYLRIGATTRGVHYSDPTPSIQVYTGGLPAAAWSEDFSHEAIETLVDPTFTDYFANGTASALEVADPVDGLGYRLDGVWVADFVLPAYFSGAMLDTLTIGSVTCPASGGQCAFNGPLIAPANAPGPYDEQGKLTRPWDAVQERATPAPTF